MFPQYTATQRDRFWSKVDTTGDCWLWTAGCDRDGYGRFSVYDTAGKSHWIKASRLAWGFTNGPIPDDLWVLHTCDVAACCNPSHLYLGTHADNTADKVARGRNATGERHGSRTKPERVPYGDRHAWAVCPERMAWGERNGSAKLTWDKVRSIRARYAAGGTSYDKLALEYGVTKQSISAVIKGETWQEDLNGS